MRLLRPLIAALLLFSASPLFGEETVSMPRRISTLVIPVQFPNQSFYIDMPRASLDALFNQSGYSERSATGSVRDYFIDNIGNTCNFQFDVCNPVSVSKNYDYYGANENGVTDINVKQLVVDACKAAHAAGVDFSKYDSDGNKTVDNVFLIVAGYNEAESSVAERLWPQSWNIDSEELVLDGVRISSFSLYSEFSGKDGREPLGIGTICHEYCHFLGLLDMYDVNGIEEGLSTGLSGNLSIMDHGYQIDNGKTPPYLNIIERETLGLVRKIWIRSGEHLQIPPVQNSEIAYAIPASSDSSEYFIIEYRNGDKWDKSIGGRGMVIYHVDRSGNTAGSMSAATRWKVNAVNGCGYHSCAIPVPSSENSTFEMEELFFPGVNNVTTVHSTKNFALMGWNDKGVGLGFENITIELNSISFDVVRDIGWYLPYVTGYSVEAGQTYASLSWEFERAAIGEWVITLDDSSSPEILTVSTTNSNYLFENLKPGEQYKFTVKNRTGSLEGKPYQGSFTTVKKANDFPLISNLFRKFKVGESIKLEIINIAEEFSSITWYVNGQRWDDEAYKFTVAGKYMIQADIEYPDKSVESLFKTLEVNE